MLKSCLTLFSILIVNENILPKNLNYKIFQHLQELGCLKLQFNEISCAVSVLCWFCFRFCPPPLVTRYI